MATIIDALIVTLGLDPKGFKKGTDDATQSLDKLDKASDKQAKVADKQSKDQQAQAKKLTESYAKVRNEILSITAAIVGAVAGKEFLQRITATDAAVGRMARNVGMNTESLTQWQGVAARSGGSAEGLAGSIKNIVSQMQQFALTGQMGDMVKYFRAVNVPLTTAAGKLRDMNDVMLDVADRFQGMDPAKAQALGAGMGFDEGTVNVLLQGRAAITALLAEQKQLGYANKEDADAAAKRQSAWRGLSQAFDDLGRKIATTLTPIILELTKVLTAFLEFAKQHMPLTIAIVGALAIALGAVAAVRFAGIVASVLSMTGALGGANVAAGALALTMGKVVALAGAFAAGYEIANAMGAGEAGGWIGRKLFDLTHEKYDPNKPSGGGVADSSFGRLISKGEGGYNSVNLGAAGGYKAGTENLEGMTVGQVMANQANKRFNAVGRYQMIPSTLAAGVKALGIGPNELFNKSTQDRLFEQYLLNNKQKAIGDYISGRSNDLLGAVSAASREWASIADPATGMSHYAGVGNNKATITSQSVAESLRNARAVQMSAMNRGAPSAGNTSTSKTDVSVGGVTIITDQKTASAIGGTVAGAVQRQIVAAQANTLLN